jgi:L-ascorbate metabolism protein UlaG (beta-lactamase superfamily)
MIEPVLKDDAFLADVAAARREEDALHIWWLGQSGFLIQWRGRHALLDPYLSDALTRKYAGTDKPHVRMTARVIAPERLDFIDLVTSSHNHTDHLDAETLGPLLHASPGAAFAIPEANRAFVAERLGIDPARPIGLDDGVARTAGGFELTGLPSAHETVDRDEQGRHRYLGYVLRLGPWSVYHSGDTVLYDGMVPRLARSRIDVALLPINGRRPERRVPGNLDGLEAARLARDIGARFVIPCHFEMFEFNTASPEEFAAEAERIGQDYRVLQAGERLSLRATPG